jgi:hypothetical protein
MTDILEGGYPSEIFIGTPDERFTCPLCMDILKEPVQCSNGHMFCKACISKAITVRKQCPTCRCSLTESKLSKSLIIRDMVLDLPVMCSSKLVTPKSSEHCCQWTGKLSTLKQHESSCEFQNAMCDNEGCRRQFSNYQMVEHRKACKFNKIKCQYCRQETFGYCLLYHMARCVMNPSDEMKQKYASYEEIGNQRREQSTSSCPPPANQQTQTGSLLDGGSFARLQINEEVRPVVAGQSESETNRKRSSNNGSSVAYNGPFSPGINYTFHIGSTGNSKKSGIGSKIRARRRKSL